DDIIDLTNKLYSELNVKNLDLHSPDFVYSLPSKEYVKVERVQPKIVTGAGDYWNAANFYGYIKGFNDLERLKFANEFAKKYVSGSAPAGT
ncbi:MAG: hypothetical protein ACPLX8_01485, partial [Nanopusillaceae archaeon]